MHPLVTMMIKCPSPQRLKLLKSCSTPFFFLLHQTPCPCPVLQTLESLSFVCRAKRQIFFMKALSFIRVPTDITSHQQIKYPFLTSHWNQSFSINSEIFLLVGFTNGLFIKKSFKDKLKDIMRKTHQGEQERHSSERRLQSAEGNENTVAYIHTSSHYRLCYYNGFAVHHFPSLLQSLSEK